MSDSLRSGLYSKMLSAQPNMECSIFIQPTDIAYDQHEIIIVQFPKLLYCGLKQGRVLGRIIEELTWCDSKVVADLQKFCHGWQRLAGGNVVDIAAAMSQVIAHLIFRDTLLDSQLGNPVAYELRVHMTLTTYSPIL